MVKRLHRVRGDDVELADAVGGDVRDGHLDAAVVAVPVEPDLEAVARPAHSDADGAKADAADTDGADADGAKADGAKPDGAKADGAKADGAKPDDAKPDDAKADGSEADGSEAAGADADVVVGAGTIERVVVDGARFLARAQANP